VQFAGGYVQVGLVAALTTAAITPLVRRYATRLGFVTLPDERRVHVLPTPALGGVAMYVGFVAAFGFAWKVRRFAPVFKDSLEPLGIFLAATVVFLVGFIDDLKKSHPKNNKEGISAPAKFSGLVLAGTVLAVFGVTMWHLRIPSFIGRQILVLPGDLRPLFIILWLAGMANAINFIDGLDGLAAGTIAISSAAFFLYSREMDNKHLLFGPSIGPLIAVIVCGICVGFIPYNFHPAKIFMGDCGALLLGGLMAVCTAVVGGRANPLEGSPGANGQTFFFFAPIVIPLVILGVPLFDTAFAILRRASQRQGIAVADKGHLHHRLLRLGHGHRRSVSILWAWTTLLSGVVLFPVYSGGRGNGVVLFALIALGLALYTLFHPEVRQRREESSGNVENGIQQ
jgi:UDP-GlcNAc:undecaprenyl-phosphate/decaprenyl-phosphate GlcNAc-1-phosphate transferase